MIKVQTRAVVLKVRRKKRRWETFLRLHHQFLATKRLVSNQKALVSNQKKG